MNETALERIVTLIGDLEASSEIPSIDSPTLPPSKPSISISNMFFMSLFLGVSLMPAVHR